MESALRILVILASTRRGRIGERVARWFMPIAEGHPDLACELVDLRDWPLPFYEGEGLPAMGAGMVEARRWADLIGGADGFVVLTPEYNYGPPAVLKNAFDHVYAEWNAKPISFVGYGGWAGGSRSVQQLRLTSIELQMVPIREHLVLPFARTMLDEHGAMTGPTADRYREAAGKLLDQLAWWARALREARVGDRGEVSAR
jgi:NAD(P)H-dependent FMN reductase